MTLEPNERALLKRLMSHPMDLPDEFRSWGREYFGASNSVSAAGPTRLSANVHVFQNAEIGTVGADAWSSASVALGGLKLVLLQFRFQADGSATGTAGTQLSLVMSDAPTPTSQYSGVLGVANLGHDITGAGKRSDVATANSYGSSPGVTLTFSSTVAGASPYGATPNLSFGLSGDSINGTLVYLSVA